MVLWCECQGVCLNTGCWRLMCASGCLLRHWLVEIVGGCCGKRRWCGRQIMCSNNDWRLLDG